MSDKLCVCGHEMKPQGKQTLEMNGSSLGSTLDGSRSGRSVHLLVVRPHGVF